MPQLYQVTGHQPVEPDRGPEGDVVPPFKDEPGPTGAPKRKHHDPEDPGSGDAQ